MVFADYLQIFLNYTLEDLQGVELMNFFRYISQIWSVGEAPGSTLLRGDIL